MLHSFKSDSKTAVERGGAPPESSTLTAADKAGCSVADRYRTIAENTLDWEYWLAPDGQWVYISPSCEMVSGYAREEFERNPALMEQIVHPEDRPRYRAHVSARSSTPSIQAITYRIIHLDGQLRWIEQICRPLYDQAGVFLGTRGSNRDITDRKRLEEQLHLAHAYNRSLIEASLDPMMVIGPDGLITDVNHATELATGHTRCELVGTESSNYFSDPEGSRAAYQKVLQDGCVRDYVAHIEHSDGHVTPVLCNGSRYRDELKQTTGVCMASRDITELQSAQEKEAGSVRRLQGINRLQEELLSPASLSDKLRRIAEAAVELSNLDLVRIWLLRPGDLCSHGCMHATASGTHHCRPHGHCLHLVTSCERGAHADGDQQRIPVGGDPLDRIASGGKIEIPGNTSPPDPSGHSRTLAQELGLTASAGYQLADANNNPTGLLAAFSQHAVSLCDRILLSHLAGTTSKVIADSVVEDELREKRMLAEAASRAKTEFLANMSHELRTPLTSILGFSDLLLTDAATSSSEQREFLVAIQRNGYELLRLIDDILGLASIVDDQLSLETADCPLLPFVNDVLSSIRPQMDQKHLAMNFECRDALPTSIHTDSKRLRQLLLILMGNAVKFTERGSVSLAVRFQRESPSLGRLQFSISDTGIGIPTDKLESIFRPFTQADYSLTRRFGGTGLGLNVAQGLATALGGRIDVISTLHQGSTFTVTFDAMAVGTPSAEQSSPTAAKTDPPHTTSPLG